MKKKVINTFLCFLFAFCSTIINAQTCNYLCNTDFEDSIVVSPGHMALVSQAQVPCWNTTESDGLIEVWGTGFNGVPAYSGNQFIELNANNVSTLYQNFYAGAGANVTVAFAHRGRSGIDSMSVSIGPVGGPYITLGIFGDGNTAWGHYSLSYIFPSMGNYSLRFNSIYATGGIQSIGNFLDFISISLPSITATVASSDVLCYNGTNGTVSVSITSGASPYTYSWNPSGDSSATVNDLPAGNYTCTITDANGCTNTVSATISEPPVLNSTIQSTIALCYGDSSGYATVNSSGGILPYTFLWSNTQTTQTAIWLIAGTYTVTVTDSAGCTTTAQTTISLNNNPTATASSNSPVCEGQDINLTSTGGITYTYNWSGPNGFSSSSQNPTITGTTTAANGTYTVTITDITGCSATTQTIVTVNATPMVSISASASPICAGALTTLTASGATTYSWSGGLGTSNPVTVTPLSTTTYTVTGTTAGCTGTASITVTVNGLTINLSPVAASICEGNSTILSATGATTYIWEPSAGLSSSSGATITASPVSTTTYTVTGVTGGCSGSVTVIVTVTPYPVITVIPDSISICAGTNASLSARGATDYTWSPSTGLNTTTGADVTANPSLSTTYLVTGTTEGCTGSASVAVSIMVSDTGLLVPNIFTPNGDGFNDIFKVVFSSNSEIEGLIFNRWGNLIFRWNKVKDGWDGTYKGKMVPDGVYMYVITATDECGNKFTEHGTVSVLK